jgi:hypothetical protein
VEPLNVEGTSGGGGSSRDDRKTHKLPRLDVITKLIVDGDEEELLEVMRRMGTQQLRERTVDFLEKNNTGIDDAHSLKDKLVKLRNFQAAGVFMRMYEQKTLDKKKNLELWTSLITENGSSTEEEEERMTNWTNATPSGKKHQTKRRRMTDGTRSLTRT